MKHITISPLVGELFIVDKRYQCLYYRDVLPDEKEQTFNQQYAKAYFLSGYGTNIKTTIFVLEDHPNIKINVQNFVTSHPGKKSYQLIQQSFVKVFISNSIGDQLIKYILISELERVTIKRRK